MSCTMRQSAEAFAAGRLSSSEAEAFRGHAAGCADCTALLREIRAVRGLLADYAPYEPNELELARLDRNVLEALEKAPRRRFSLRPFAWAGLVAAATAAMVLALQPKPAEVPPVAVVPPAAPPALAAAVGLGDDASYEPGEPMQQALGPGTTFKAGDRLRSGRGSLSVQTAAATGVHLPSGSELRLARHDARSTELELLRGSVLAQVKPLAPGNRFEVRVGDLLVAVRGTAFAVHRLDGRARIEVEHGLVEVSRPASGEAVLVPGPGSLEVVDGAVLDAALVSSALAAQTRAMLPLGFVDLPLDAVLSDYRPLPIASDPAGARVRIDGKYRGITPLTGLEAPGPHAVSLEYPDRAPMELTLEAGGPPPGVVVLPATVLDEVDQKLGSTTSAQKTGRPIGRLAPKAQQQLEDPQIVARRQAMAFQVRTHMRDLVHCYERAMKRNPDLAGTVVMAVTFDPTGQVSEISTADGGPADSGFVSCARELILRWALPGTGEEESFEIPLALSPR